MKVYLTTLNARVLFQMKKIRTSHRKIQSTGVLLSKTPSMCSTGRIIRHALQHTVILLDQPAGCAVSHSHSVVPGGLEVKS